MYCSKYHSIHSFSNVNTGEEETKSESNEGDVPESCVTPKKMKSAKGRCKLCGGMGHNRRTCKKASEGPEIDLL